MLCYAVPCQVRMQPAVQLDARLHKPCPTHHHEAQRHLDAVAADQALPPVLHVSIIFIYEQYTVYITHQLRKR